jgi:hypothetical protein
MQQVFKFLRCTSGSGGASEKVKNLRACQQKSYPSRDPDPLTDKISQPLQEKCFYSCVTTGYGNSAHN